MKIRQENPADKAAIACVITEAFAKAARSDGNEVELVQALRQGISYLPDLSLVAEEDGQIIGYILFTKAKVGKETVLALAPLAVLPDYQKQGVGSALVEEGHRIAKRLGYRYVVVLGSETYYPRFGYEIADTWGIYPPFDVPRENFMACRLDSDAPVLHGLMIYAKEFGIPE